ncbi:MAG: hypothetical protein FWG29_03720 [Treponema sp.]|nr:hypothetical protein [Treponema sp.]
MFFEVSGNAGNISTSSSGGAGIATVKIAKVSLSPKDGMSTRGRVDVLYVKQAKRYGGKGKDQSVIMFGIFEQISLGM